MKDALIALTIASASGSALAGGSIVQTLDYSYSSGLFSEPYSLAGFDDMGGTRVLTGVSVGVQADLSMTMLVSNSDSVQYNSGEWSMDATHDVAVSFLNDFGPPGGEEEFRGLDEEPEDPEPSDDPTLLFDGISISEYTADLGSGSTLTPNGSGAVDQTKFFDASVLAFFSSNETVSFNIDGSPDIDLTLPFGAFGVSAFPVDLSQDGSITLTYQYENVPAPASLAALGLGGLAATRRRR